jgi:hypothetical protein
MSPNWRTAIFILGAIPLGLVAFVLWPLTNIWGAIILMIVYQVLVQPWAMGLGWWWKKRGET